MKKSAYSINELKSAPVFDAKKRQKRLGKVHSFVFHPQKRRVVGFTVKCPDVALMFHRPDLFVALDSFEVEDGNIHVSEGNAATGKAACKRMGIAWDECILWQGLPLMTEDGKRCGYVGDVVFETETGAVVSITVDRGKSAEVLLGTAEIPAAWIRGFKLGVGDKLATAEGDDFMHGAIIVSSEALSVSAEGGVAEKAGAATAVAAAKVSNVADKVKPAASQAAHKTGEAVNKGAFALGSQLGKTRGMFSSFKEEYRRASKGEDDS